MAILFTKQQAMKELPFIADIALFKGVDLALWLYLDKHWSFKNAVSKAAEKHAVKPKVAIERILRQVIPEELFLDRMDQAIPRKPKSVSKETAIMGQKLRKMEVEAKVHVVDITRR
ncbi:hypothetical protein [Photobacterium leiognathi]|uniref:hypothetical protein n=1 Tax=Photobacterium leiognathi TaxID=553611 RepID=UPI0027391DBC|nr:hypothetical protein [Photobacterium leiognathi]